MGAKKEITTFVVSLGVAMVMGSCADDGEPSLLIKAEVESFASDRWVIISDRDGHLLDYKQYVSKGVMEFKGPRAQEVIYTTFDWTGWGYIVSSTQGIPVGTELTLDTTPTQSNDPPVQGQATFTLSDLSIDTSVDPYYLQESVEFGAKYWTHTLLGLISPEYQGSTLSFGLSLQSVPSDVLGIGYRQGKPVYQWFKGVSPGDEIAASFSSFLPCKIIPINKKVASFGVVGLYGDYINGGIGYSLSRISNWRYSLSSDKSEIPMPGYIDGFDNYWIGVTLNNLSCCDAMENVLFDSFGPVPASIDLPDYTYTLKNQSLGNFSFNFSNDYSYQDAFFTIDGKKDSQSEIWWNVIAPAGQKLVQIHLPSEILAKYPDFTADQLKVNVLKLVKELDGTTYGDVFCKHTNFFFRRFQKLTYQFQYK